MERPFNEGEGVLIDLDGILRILTNIELFCVKAHQKHIIQYLPPSLFTDLQYSAVLSYITCLGGTSSDI